MGEAARDGPWPISSRPRYGQTVASNLFALSPLYIRLVSALIAREQLARRGICLLKPGCSGSEVTTSRDFAHSLTRDTQNRLAEFSY